jgi:CRISPR/Cas system-associated protein Cas10 (large subunit of type III CRISPR-Cas system)
MLHNNVRREKQSMRKEEHRERRKYQRFRAKDGALIELRSHRGKLGEIIDISKGGLSFRYIDIGDRPKGSFEVDIFLKETSFRLEKVPAKTVSDLKTTQYFPYSSTKTRRQGVQFGELTRDQISKLEHFIKNCTTGEV